MGEGVGSFSFPHVRRYLTVLCYGTGGRRTAALVGFLAPCSREGFLSLNAVLAQREHVCGMQ